MKEKWQNPLNMECLETGETIKSRKYLEPGEMAKSIQYGKCQETGEPTKSLECGKCLKPGGLYFCWIKDICNTRYIFMHFPLDH